MPPVTAVRNEHPYRVARDPPRFWRNRRLELGGSSNDRRSRARRAVAAVATRRVAPTVSSLAALCSASQCSESRSPCNDRSAGRFRSGPPGARDDGFWKRSVRDVLAGESLLMHVGAEVTGIDGPRRGARILRCRAWRSRGPRRLSRVRTTPSLVVLDRGVRRDVDHRGRVDSVEQADGLLHEATGSEHVDLEDVAQGLERVIHEPRQAGFRRACSRC